MNSSIACKYLITVEKQSITFLQLFLYYLISFVFIYVFKCIFSSSKSDWSGGIFTNSDINGDAVWGQALD